jgi:hypothetical protein
MARRAWMCIAWAGLGLAAGCGDSQQSGGGSFLQQVAEAKRIADPEARARKLLTIAGKQVDVQDSSGAQDTLSEAEAACRDVTPPATQSRLLAQVAYRYSRTMNDSAARRAIKSAADAADKIKLEKPADYRNKVLALTDLAQAYHAIRDTNEAVAALRLAENLNTQIKGDQGDSLRRLQVENLNSVASIYQVIEKPEHGQRLAAQALEQAQGLTKADDRADLLATVAVVQSELNMNEADATFELAEKAAGQIAELHLQGAALLAIAAKLARAGRHERAVALLNKADQVADRVKDKAFREGLKKQIREALPQ